MKSTFFRGGGNLKVKSLEEEDRRAALTKIDSSPFRHLACSRIRLFSLKTIAFYFCSSFVCSVFITFE